jgi:hypothetical protein
MKRREFACLVAISVSAVCLFGAISLSFGATRVVRNISANWKFNQGDATGAESPTFIDASWQTVQLPHTPAYTEYQLSMSATGFWRGICWYRKSIAVDAAMQGKKVFLEFQGAMTVAQVYVNGTPVTTHSGGFTPFIIDITGSITYGGGNVVAVKLDNTCQQSVPPEKPGDCFIDYTLYGGIYRDVNLIATDSLYVPSPLLSPGGIFITTPAVTASSATVKVKTAVKNEYKTSQTCILKTTILDKNGASVGSASTTQSIAAQATYTFIQTITVANPSLWSPTNPAMYKAISEVSDNTILVDTLENSFGIRSILFNSTGFYLNGNKVKLLGVNRHQTFPFIGEALPDRAQYRDARVLKDMGCNYIRLSHYPQSPAFLNALDELGIMCWEEVPTWGGNGNAYTNAWYQTHYQDIRDMIRRDRNHPSVICWGVGANEGINDPAFENTCQSVAKAEDSTRFTTAAKNYVDASNNRFDIYGGNIFVPQDLPTSASAFGLGTGNLVGFINSEYTGHTFPTHRWDDIFTLIECANRHLAMINADRQRDWVAGGSCWCGFDYTSDPDDFPADGGQDMGIKYHGVMDMFRIPKIAYYVYQSQSAADLYDGSKHPMIFMESFADYAMPSTQTVQILSNCDQVELFVNGISQGTQSPDASNTANTTRWCANDANTGNWWMVDLGASYDLTGTQVTWENPGVVYQYEIETSANATAWTTAVDKTAGTNTSQTQKYNFTANGVRYVRITITGLPAGKWASFYDFEVFSGGKNVAVGKTASASSEQGGNPASNGNDIAATPWALAHAPFTFANVGYDSPGTLRADGKIGGAVVASQTLNRPGTASKISLRSDADTLLPDGTDIARIIVSILDNNTTLLHAATNTVNVTASGSGKVICGSAGPQASGSFAVKGGQWGFLVQSGFSEGTITVTATSGALTQGKNTIVVAAQPVGVLGRQSAPPAPGIFRVPVIRFQGRRIVFDNLDKNVPSRIMLVSMNGRAIENIRLSGQPWYALGTTKYPGGAYVVTCKNGMQMVQKNIVLMK